MRRFVPSPGGGLLLLVARAALATATERRARLRVRHRIVDGQGGHGASGRRCRRLNDGWDMSDRCRVLLLRSVHRQSHEARLFVSVAPNDAVLKAGLVLDTQWDERPGAERRLDSGKAMRLSSHVAKPRSGRVNTACTRPSSSRAPDHRRKLLSGAWLQPLWRFNSN